MRWIDGAVVANLESVKPEIKSTVFFSGLEGPVGGHFSTSPFSPCRVLLSILYMSTALAHLVLISFVELLGLLSSSPCLPPTVNDLPRGQQLGSGRV